MNQTNLSIRIILTFTVMFFVSFLPALNPGLFGDWMCNGLDYGNDYKGFWNGKYPMCSYNQSHHSPELHWGWRHFILILMSLCLFIQQVVYIINKSIK